MSIAAGSVHARAAAWRRESGFGPWLAEHNHRAIGLRIIVTGFTFFALAGVAALVMRVQLAQPDRTVLDPETYDQLFSVHGSTMMSAFAVPTGLGFALYVVPLELGAREAALPRLAAFAYWLFAAAGATLWLALAFGEAPDSGWFNYVPLASPRYQPGFHADVYAGSMLLLQVSALCLAVVLITTILCRRAPGMALHLMPLMAWAVLIACVMIVFAMPPLVVGCTMLVMESKLGASFFAVPLGGDPLLWQQLFWFFGHPLVYLMLLPALGVVSSVTASFAKRPMVGYPLIVTSYVLIGWMPQRALGVGAFALIFIGVNTTFFPMHALGLQDMRRRVWTYPAGLGFGDLNLLATVGAFIIGAGPLLFVAGLLAGVRRRPAGPDPWGSGTLEWATESPPGPHAFDRTPVVTSHYPLWEQEDLGDAEARHSLAPDRREMIGTSAVRAVPERLDEDPPRVESPAVAALCAALAVAGTIVDPLIGVGGLILTFVACVDWLRPRPLGEPTPDMTLPAAEAARMRGLRPPSWYGATLGLAILFIITGTWLVSWYYLAAKNGEWPIPPVEPRPLLFGLGLTLLLGAAVTAVVLARRRATTVRLALAAALAAAFCALQVVELIAIDYNQATNASASAEWAITAAFGLLVLVLAGMAAVSAGWARRGLLRPATGHGSLAMYALFLGASWPLVAFTVYVAPRLAL